MPEAFITELVALTRSIAEEVHPEIVTILWQLIDAKQMPNVELDYL